MRREGATDGERLDTLSSYLERRISTDPKTYHTIVEVLKDEPALEAVGNLMQGQFYNPTVGQMIVSSRLLNFCFCRTL